jgi:hypothetical protein
MIDLSNKLGYEAIKHLAKHYGVTIPELLVLARQNDPFFAGAPAPRARAEWFYSLWQAFGFGEGVHLRRIHYQLVSQPDPRRHDGKPYENTDNGWNYLCDASKAARYLGLVDAQRFADRRNPDPHLFAADYGDGDYPEIDFEPFDWQLPAIETQLRLDDLTFPYPLVGGYGYSPGDQPVLLEIWAEKSTMNDVLLPICRRYGANLVTGVGYQSITSAISLLSRTQKSHKPARIFYLSDFDPAGVWMPAATARQLEYWARDHYGLDIKLEPLVLSKAQVIDYRLPRTPIKESDLRRRGFEERYGEGAVELDALEALYPGQLAKVVESALEPYFDDSLEANLDWAGDEAAETAHKEWQAVIHHYQPKMDEIKAEAGEIISHYQGRLDGLAESLNKKLRPVAVKLKMLQQAIQDEIAGFRPALPVRPEPEIEGTDESGWLFDNGREYLEQLAIYKARKEGSQ